MQAIRYQFEESVATATLIREESRNAIDRQLVSELLEVIQWARRDSARVLVLTGTGSAFCAGADLKMVEELRAQGPTEIVEQFLKPLQRALREIRALPAPVIAAVNGACFAGGLETVLSCDIIIACESARFSDAHARYGLLPGVGGVHALVRSLGSFKAKEMLFSAGVYSAHEMCAAGLVTKVVPDEELLPAAMEFARRLSLHSAPGLASMKQMVNDEGEMVWDAAARYELALLAAHLANEDFAEGLSAFSEKRLPLFKSKVP